jgi:hypothetical protein
LLIHETGNGLGNVGIKIKFLVVVRLLDLVATVCWLWNCAQPRDTATWLHLRRRGIVTEVPRLAGGRAKNLIGAALYQVAALGASSHKKEGEKWWGKPFGKPFANRSRTAFSAEITLF